MDMHHAHADGSNVLISDNYKDSSIIARPIEERVARVHWATYEPRPSAPNRAAVRENCQGWTIRVIGNAVNGLNELVLDANRSDYEVLEVRWANLKVNPFKPVVT